MKTINEQVSLIKMGGESNKGNLNQSYYFKSRHLKHRENNKNDKMSRCELTSNNPAFIAALDLARRAAKSSASILITGESGSGKEVFANFIHRKSQYWHGPFVPVNSSSIPKDLLESELFGHAKGSFTGATEKRIGLFEAAENGTLFLDEIGDLSFPLQAKLLRVLQEKNIKRVGENVHRIINCRIISATNKNLSQEVEEGRFREDLFYRLNVIPIVIPPLRERTEDIMLLSEYFLKRFCQINDTGYKFFAEEAVQFLLHNKWRGNIRELENSIERAVIICKHQEIVASDLMSPSLNAVSMNYDYNMMRSIISEDNKSTFSISYLNRLPKLDDVINNYIYYAIEKNSGAKDKTAMQIGINRKTLYKRLAEHLKKNSNQS